MFVKPLSAAFSSANASARGLTSVATTSRAWRAESIACTPLPVPMSSARSIGPRGVSASHSFEVGV